jgi:ferredoxin
VSRWSLELVIDPIACDGRGVCAELLPESIELDRWGYPVVADGGIAPAPFGRAVRAVSARPVHGLQLLERAC